MPANSSSLKTYNMEHATNEPEIFIRQANTACESSLQTTPVAATEFTTEEGRARQEWNAAVKGYILDNDEIQEWQDYLEHPDRKGVPLEAFSQDTTWLQWLRT